MKTDSDERKSIMWEMLLLMHFTFANGKALDVKIERDQWFNEPDQCLVYGSERKASFLKDINGGQVGFDGVEPGTKFVVITETACDYHQVEMS